MRYHNHGSSMAGRWYSEGQCDSATEGGSKWTPQRPGIPPFYAYGVVCKIVSSTTAAPLVAMVIAIVTQSASFARVGLAES
jgi:hypothetical protein